MKSAYLICILLFLPSVFFGQKIKKALTTLEELRKDSFYPIEKLEEEFDKKGRLTKKKYTDLKDPLKKSMIIEYEYKDDKNQILTISYTNSNLSKPKISYKREIIKKKFGKRGFIEQYVFENIQRPLFFHSFELEESFETTFKSRDKNIPLDTAVFNVPTHFRNEEGYDFILIQKKYKSLENKIIKATFGYQRDPSARKKSDILRLSIGTLYEKTNNDNIREISLSFSQSNLYTSDGERILNSKDNVIKKGNKDYKYEYDEKGHWIKKIKRKNGKVFQQELRKLTY